MFSKHLFKYSLALTALMVLSACSLGDFLKPKAPFDASKIVPAPDYRQAENWIALPTTSDLADAVSPGQKNQQAQAAADVFFVHPTAWFSRDVWNHPLKDVQAQEITDQISMASQASAFNASAKIYAPRYRQATLGVYYASPEEAEQSMDIAYQDIEAAFETYLKTYNQGRPFILAGHSQGSMHLFRLLEKISADPQLKERFVTAYLPGQALPLTLYHTNFPELEACQSPTQIGCINAWDTYREGADVKGSEPMIYWKNKHLVRFALDEPRQCSNPISWQSHTTPSPRASHQGAVEMINQGNSFQFMDLLFSNKPLGVKITGLKPPRQALVSAFCEGNALRVQDLKALKYPAMETQPGNYHLLDYELFYQDIRLNATKRVQAWLKQQDSKVETNQPASARGE